MNGLFLMRLPTDLLLVVLRVVVDNSYIQGHDNRSIERPCFELCSSRYAESNLKFVTSQKLESADKHEIRAIELSIYLLYPAFLAEKKCDFKTSGMTRSRIEATKRTRYRKTPSVPNQFFVCSIY